MGVAHQVPQVTLSQPALGRHWTIQKRSPADVREVAALVHSPIKTQPEAAKSSASDGAGADAVGQAAQRQTPAAVGAQTSGCL